MTPNDPLVGRVLGDRYRLTRKLGEGGFGVVYAAEHVSLGSPLAVKILRRNLESNPQFAKRFEREARVTANLHHPGIVRVTDFGNDPTAGTYLVMEHLRGEDLSDRIGREGPLPPQDAVTVFTAIVEAFAFAHRAGVVHRDVKSSNVFLVDDEHATSPVKVLDFGIAHLVSDDFQNEARLTQAGAVLGSVHYMSPEQALGARVDRRSDLYSLGVVFFEMLTGAVPFQGASALEVLSLHVKEVPRPPSITRTDRMIPLHLDQIVLRCLQKSTRERYQDAEQILADLKAAGEFLHSAESAPAGLDATVDQLRLSMQHDVALLSEASSREQRRIVSGSSKPGTPDDDDVADLRLPGRPPWLLPLVLVLALVAAAVVASLVLRAPDKAPPVPPPPVPDATTPARETVSTGAKAPVEAPAKEPDLPPPPEPKPEVVVPPGHDLVLITEGVDGVLVHWEDGKGDAMVSPTTLSITPADDGRILVFEKKGYDVRREVVRYDAWKQRLDVRVPITKRRVSAPSPSECPKDDPFCKDRK